MDRTSIAKTDIDEADHRNGILRSEDDAHVQTRHASGRLTARERLAALLDPGSFEQWAASPFAVTDGTSVANLLTGTGRVNGRPVAVFSFDVPAGEALAADQPEPAQALERLVERAMVEAMPLIGLHDGGDRSHELRGVEDETNHLFRCLAHAEGVVPRIALVVGDCVGAAAIVAALADIAFMVRGSAQLCLTGADVVDSVMGQRIDGPALGGGDIHAERSGLADMPFDNEVEALVETRRLLGFLPSSPDHPAPRSATRDVPDRTEPALDTLASGVSGTAYDVGELIAAIADERESAPLAEAFARNVWTGLIRLGGGVVGILANQPSALGGCLDRDGLAKAGRFVRLCDAFAIPLLGVVDTPGFLPGPEEEAGGITREAAGLAAANARARMPRVSLAIGKTGGAARMLMTGSDPDRCVTLHWPSFQGDGRGGHEPDGLPPPAGTAIVPRETRREVLAAFGRLGALTATTSPVEA